MYFCFQFYMQIKTDRQRDREGQLGSLTDGQAGLGGTGGTERRGRLRAGG